MRRLLLALSLVGVLLAPAAPANAQAPCQNVAPREVPQISMANEPGGVRVVLTTKVTPIHAIDYNWSTRVNANPQAPSYNGTVANFFVAIPNGGQPWFLAFNGCAGPVGAPGHWYKFVGNGGN